MEVPLRPSQAILESLDMLQSTQNTIRLLADTSQNHAVKEELNKAYVSIDACIKQCQTASAHLS
jgi:hypothetical protein